jgi:hypothetical protein
MINVLELVYGGGLTPNPNPIHIFDPDRDLYEHAEFYKDNGDFYQIVKISDTKVLYHFQKTDAAIDAIKFEGDWWLRPDTFTRTYENRVGIFYEKISDRLTHKYRVARLVIVNRPLAVDANHPDYKAIRKVYE